MTSKPGDYGLDFAWDRPSIQAIKDGGYTFVCRYISFNKTGKNITKAEYASYLLAGLDVCLNWEYSKDDQKRGAAGGRVDGAEAFKQAQALGAPSGAVIYCSADWDVQPDELSVCRAYWAAFKHEMKGVYRVGVYGGYRAVSAALDAGYHGWQTYAWSYGKWSAAHFRQIKNGITVGGADCDRNQLIRPDAGFVENTMTITDEDAKKIATTWSGSDTVPWDPAKNYTNGGALYDTAQRVIELRQMVTDLTAKVDAMAAAGGPDNAPVLAVLAAMQAEFSELRTKLSAAYAV